MNCSSLLISIRFFNICSVDKFQHFNIEKDRTLQILKLNHGPYTRLFFFFYFEDIFSGILKSCLFGLSAFLYIHDYWIVLILFKWGDTQIIVCFILILMIIFLIVGCFIENHLKVFESGWYTIWEACPKFFWFFIFFFAWLIGRFWCWTLV